MPADSHWLASTAQGCLCGPLDGDTDAWDLGGGDQNGEFTWAQKALVVWREAGKCSISC